MIGSIKELSSNGIGGSQGSNGGTGPKGDTGPKGATGAAGSGARFISNNQEDLLEFLETTPRLKNVYGNQLTMQKILNKTENIYGEDKDFFGAKEVIISGYSDTITLHTTEENAILTRAIVDEAFSMKPNATKLIISGYETIGSDLFKNVTNGSKINSIILKGGIKYIGTDEEGNTIESGASFKSTSIESIHIPKSVVHI